MPPHQPAWEEQKCAQGEGAGTGAPILLQNSTKKRGTERTDLAQTGRKVFGSGSGDHDGKDDASEDWVLLGSPYLPYQQGQ